MMQMMSSLASLAATQYGGWRRVGVVDPSVVEAGSRAGLRLGSGWSGVWLLGRAMVHGH